MDSPHSETSLPTSTNTHDASSLRTSAPPIRKPRSKRYSEPIPSKQRRLLQTRNAKFPAKKLSLSNIGAKFTQLIHANDEPKAASTPDLNQENISPQSVQKSHNRRHTSGNSLGILEEITNSTLHRKLRHSKSGNILIFEDSPERPLLESSPYSSPLVDREPRSQEQSPVAFDHIQDSLGGMRLREISGNEFRGSPLAQTPLHGSIKAAKKHKLIRTSTAFDTQEYIDYIERELQQARNEMFSPTSNKSLKDQLHSARKENETLKQDMIEMRDMYETAVKKDIEHRATLEVTMKRKVRDLEEELEQKEFLIKDLELQYDERRLDTSTIDNLKTAIERLEQDKLSLEDENRSITKRNEVLSELLAMSPTKSQSVDLKSPTRERRGGKRPMSMIIPRLPNSPTGYPSSKLSSALTSPVASSCAPVFNHVSSRPSSPRSIVHGLGLINTDEMTMSNQVLGSSGIGYFDQQQSSRASSRRSTIQSQGSRNGSMSGVSYPSSPIEQATCRAPPKRKPRKFMSGSTQLKPLLLPTFASDSISILGSPLTSSPQIGPYRYILQGSIDPTTSFISQPDDYFAGSTEEQYPTATDQYASDEESKISLNEYRSIQDLMIEHSTSFTTATIEGTRSGPENSNASSVCDDTIISPEQDEHMGIVSEYESLVEPGNHHPNSSTDLILFHRDNESGPAYTCLSVSPRYIGLDLCALKQLDLPEPEFDALPEPDDDASKFNVTDVPRPLFSTYVYPGQHQERHVIEAKQAGITQFDDQHNISPSLSACASDMIPDTSPTPLPMELRQRSFGDRVPARQKHPTVTETDIKDQAILSQRSSWRKSECLTATKSPLDILRAGKFGARPLAALTIRTVFGTISQCTKYVQDLKQDPLALARRVIANAWFSNWARFGKLSWWVIGLFMKPGFNPSASTQWEWDEYNGEEIARRVCHDCSSNLSQPFETGFQVDAMDRHVRFDDRVESVGSTPKNDWGTALLLWGKFSIAIMLAVGGAIVKGPAEMMKDINHSNKQRNGDAASDATYTHCHHRDSSLSPKAPPDTRCSSGHQGRYDRYPTPAKIPQMISLSLESAASLEPNTSHHHLQAANSFLTEYDVDNDETLRAAKSSRTHIADLFPRDRSQSMKFIEDVTVDRSDTASQSSEHDADTQSIDGGTLQWPPSPGPFRPASSTLWHRKWL